MKTIYGKNNGTANVTTGNLIMVVDDTPDNIKTVGELLRGQGYRIIAVTSGEAVFEALQRYTPDLILLDIMMPDVSGIDVCRRLKAIPSVAHIPIIFLSALYFKEYILSGFQAGGVDYVTKPFDALELTARVQTHLEIVESRAIILRQNEELKRLHQVKDDFIGIASHDLRTPLTGIQGMAEIMWKENKPPDKVRYFSKMIFDAAVQLNGLLQNLLDVHRIETIGLEPQRAAFDIIQTAHTIIDQHQERAEAKSISLQIQSERESLIITDDESMVRQILDNLVSNAIKYSPKEKTVIVRICYQKATTKPLKHKSVRIEVHDEGPGISEDDRKKMFGKFIRLSAKPTDGESSTGLGLSITKSFVEALGGRIWCESELGKGTQFIVELPTLNAISADGKQS